MNFLAPNSSCKCSMCLYCVGKVSGTDNVKTVYPPPNTVCVGYNNNRINVLKRGLHSLSVITALKAVSHAINSHVLTGTNPCFNKAIHVLLIHGLAVLPISIPGLSQKLPSSSVTCTEANVIS